MKRWQKIAIGVGVVAAVPVLGIFGYIGYAFATAHSRLAFPDTPYPNVAASTDPAMIERGRYLVHGPAHCSSCHSTDDREHPEKIATTPLRGGLAFHMGPLANFYAANLTSDSDTGLARRSDQEIARAIKTGILPDGQLSLLMRFSAAELADEDLVAVVSYLRTLAPEKNAVPTGEWKAFGKLLLPMFPLAPRDVNPKYAAASPEPTAERGEYLAEHVAACVGCHSPYEQSTFQRSGPKFSGGVVEASHGTDSDKEYAPPNLTSDPTGFTGRWTEDQFVARMRSGRVYPSSIMPWESFAQLDEVDLRAIYRHIHAMPPVANDTGPSYRDVGWTP